MDESDGNCGLQLRICGRVEIEAELTVTVTIRRRDAGSISMKHITAHALMRG